MRESGYNEFFFLKVEIISSEVNSSPVCKTVATISTEFFMEILLYIKLLHPLPFF